MEREASSWGLESRDVHSPNAVGSPEGSLKDPAGNTSENEEGEIFKREGNGDYEVEKIPFGLEPQSPEFEPQSPKFESQSPRFEPESPGFESRSPGFVPPSPEFGTQKS
uniref:Uncharacterized protein n=1 Tax=Mus musculus TaxID=10090 RepID=Q8BI50_MOUSE|nr:unnamed protein product [Mus musculus]